MASGSIAKLTEPGGPEPKERVQMFGAIKARHLRITTAAIVQSALADAFSLAGIQDNPAAFAHRAVEQLHAEAPNLFTDEGHPRPHRLSLATYALAFANRADMIDGAVVHRLAFMAALRRMLLGIGANEDKLPLEEVDMRLLMLANKRGKVLEEELQRHSR